MKRLELFLASMLGAVMATVLYISVRPAEAAYTPVPTGAILYFDKSTATGCPNGWTEFTSARGAYIVGLTNGGTKNTLVGSALSNQENRPAGNHNHNATVNDTASKVTWPPTGSDNPFNSGSNGITTYVNTGITVTIQNGGGGTAGQAGVTGTNAPYIQLLVCQKS